MRFYCTSFKEIQNSHSKGYAQHSESTVSPQLCSKKEKMSFTPSNCNHKVINQYAGC